MEPKFEIFKDSKEEWRFRLVAGNGEIVAQSEGYTQKHNCLGGIEVIKAIASVAKVIELED